LSPLHPFSSRLSFFTGKGGVGKSTVVASLAVEARRQGRAPLVVELGHRATMQTLFDVEHIGHDFVEVLDGVYATNVDSDRALADYVRQHVRVGAVANRIAGSESLRRFFAAAPAVTEVLTLLRLEQLWTERWDPILVDLDATGHALMFLGLPSVFDGLVPEGPIRRLLDGFASLLRDGDRSQLHLVTLPASLPVSETIELHRRLAQEHSIRLGTLFINRVRSPAIDEAARAALDAAEATGAAAEDLALLRAEQARYDDAQRQLARLDAIDMRKVRLPLESPTEAIDLAALGRLAAVEDPG